MTPDPSTTRRTAATVARGAGALLLIAAGAVHLEQYFAVYYRVIPLIGPLFVANFVLGVALGLALMLPLGRWAWWLPRLAALGGILFAAGTFIGLQISEAGTLFGFHEHGYRLAVVLSIVFEAAAFVSLVTYLIAGRTARAGPSRTAVSGAVG